MTSALLRDRFHQVVREQPVDLGLATFLIAGQADPTRADRDLMVGQQSLDRLASAIPSSGPATARLQQVLGEFRGASDDYPMLESSLLPHVLENRRGLPILLSVVWLEVARRVQIPSHGVGLPGHFVVGIGDPDGYRELVDPFGGGRVLRPSEVRRMTGHSAEPADLRPWEPLEILQRILNNIRAWADRPDRLVTKRWALELTLALPRHALALRQQLGSVMLQLGGFLEGAAELERFADEVERMDPSAAERARYAAQQARARLN